MASIKGNVLGNLRGKLGNLSARIRNGHTILSARPSSFNASDSPGSLAARAKFAVTISFTKAIMALNDLNAVWAKAKLPGMSVYNTIFKMNRQFVEAAVPTVDNIITPSGFGLPVYAAVLDANTLTLDLNALNTAAAFLPEGASFDTASGLFFFRPDNSQVGRHTIRFTAVENYHTLLSSEMDVHITVKDIISPASFIDAMSGIDLHNVPEDGVFANLDHRFGADARLFAEARSIASCENDCFHVGLLCCCTARTSAPSRQDQSEDRSGPFL